MPFILIEGTCDNSKMLRLTERMKFITPIISLYTEHSKLEPFLNVQFNERKEFRLYHNDQSSERFNCRAYHIPQSSERKIIPHNGYMVFGDRWQWDKYKNTEQVKKHSYFGKTCRRRNPCKNKRILI